jgi:hypothetical protein
MMMVLFLSAGGALQWDKARATGFPPPLWGRNREGGDNKHRACCHPSPQPSPTRGEGADRAATGTLAMDSAP